MPTRSNRDFHLDNVNNRVVEFVASYCNADVELLCFNSIFLVISQSFLYEEDQDFILYFFLK